MKVSAMLFFATKYWKDGAGITEAVAQAKEKFAGYEVTKVVDGMPDKDPDIASCDVCVAVPFSGSVQPDIIRLTGTCRHIILFAGYVSGNFSSEIRERMIYNNAGPTLMDVHAVLRQDSEKAVMIARTFAELTHRLELFRACIAVQNGRITVIGKPEDWVISVERDYTVYRKNLGVRIDIATQEELIELYRETPQTDAEEIYHYFADDAGQICEPDPGTMQHCARLAAALLRLIKRHHSDGIAIACFDLIGRLGVNPCLGLSYINGETPYVAACEGDIDSAVTMLLMKHLTREKLWMANPWLEADRSINFAHCTAPLLLHGQKQKFILRSHHETGIGASPRVYYDKDIPMSIIRYSGRTNALTINRGRSVDGEYEPSCRTQLRVVPEDYDHFIDTNLGCHQVMTFEDITGDVAKLCELLHIKIL